MGARRFAGNPVPVNLSGRIEEVVVAMVAGRVPVPQIAVTWNNRIIYAAARTSTGLSKQGTRLRDPRVELSAKSWPLLTREEQEQILIHESGHVAAGLLGYINEQHGYNWRKLMRDYGAPADRCVPLGATRRINAVFPRKRRVTRERRIQPPQYADPFGFLNAVMRGEK
jgi:predicted SprT family Zn-dependent metalloprotease